MFADFLRAFGLVFVGLPVGLMFMLFIGQLIGLGLVRVGVQPQSVPLILMWLAISIGASIGIATIRHK